jgi:hypothetical protein
MRARGGPVAAGGQRKSAARRSANPTVKPSGSPCHRSRWGGGGGAAAAGGEARATIQCTSRLLPSTGIKTMLPDACCPKPCPAYILHV